MAQQSNNSEYVNPHEVTPDKPFHIAFLREITDQYDAGIISYGKMVELLNEVAMKWHNSIIGTNEPTISKTETVQTAVEWVVFKMLQNDFYKIWPSLLERAKQMEKEQILNAYNRGNLESEIANLFAEKFYKETYNK